MRPTSARFALRLESAVRVEIARAGNETVIAIGDIANFRRSSASPIQIGGASLTIRYALKRILDAFDSSNRHRGSNVSAPSGPVTLAAFLSGEPLPYEGWRGAQCVARFKLAKDLGVSYVEVLKDGEIVSERIMSEYSAASFFLSLGIDAQ